MYVLDSKNVFWYRNKSNGGGTYFQVGTLYSTYPRFGNTANINTGLVKLTLGDADDLKGGGLSCIKVDSSFVKSLPNIVDVVLSEDKAATGYAFSIVIKRKYTGTNIYESYADLLNVSGAWKASLADGTSVGIASIAKDATLDNGNGGWTATLASTPTIDPDTVIYLELVDPAALYALTSPVDGIESIKLKVLKP